MILLDLTTALLTLVGGASFTVWTEEPPFPPEADPSTTRHVLFGYTVCWAKINTVPCPSEEELLAIPQEV